jgi:spermidine/putrescine transport system permease protein
MLFFLTLPFWVNFLVQVYAWYFLLEYKGLINNFLLKLGIINEPLILASSLFAVFLVMVYCYLPFMIMPLYSMLEKIDPRLLEASSDLGATSWQTFYRITLPLSSPGIKTGFLLVLIPAFGEFVIPSLLGGSKYMLVGTLISYFFLVARNNAYGSAFTCLSGLALVGTLVFFYAISRLWFLRNRMGR